MGKNYRKNINAGHKKGLRNNQRRQRQGMKNYKTARNNTYDKSSNQGSQSNNSFSNNTGKQLGNTNLDSNTKQWSNTNNAGNDTSSQSDYNNHSVDNIDDSTEYDSAKNYANVTDQNDFKKYGNVRRNQQLNGHLRNDYSRNDNNNKYMLYNRDNKYAGAAQGYGAYKNNVRGGMQNYRNKLAAGHRAGKLVLGTMQITDMVVPH